MAESHHAKPEAKLGFSFLDPDVQECPYEAYAALRDEAPVFKDPKSGYFVVTRYDDVRAFLLDPETFSSVGTSNKRRQMQNPERYERIRRMFEAEGWFPGTTLSQRDDPEHKQVRAMYDRAFRPGKIKDLEPFVKETVRKLFDAFIDDGHCEWVKQFAIPLPMTVIGQQMGAREEDIWRIKAWVDAWIWRLGMMQSEEEELWSVRQEIEAQQYFHVIFEALRREPDETLLSEIVNAVIPEWGRTLTENELQASMFSDTFAAGAETTANALASGVKLLIENPEVWRRLKADPEANLRTFVEEVVRLESPTQGLFRTATKDVTLHGVDIPAGSVINIRFAAANRDERHFSCPEELDLDRRNAVTHVAFGAGTHHCLGAPLARREMYWAFLALTERIDEMWFAPGKDSFKHHESIMFRGVKELHIEFKRK
jgi:cytochrome P450